MNHYIIGIRTGNRMQFLTSSEITETSNWMTDAKKYFKDEIIQLYGEDFFFLCKKEISKYESIRLFDLSLLEKELGKETVLRSKIKKFK
ncbi:MAG: hypothetical protein NTX05_04125 [Fusobacteria bacterium]|nr:hypothetical protein [Fusobacteriota bacterium]